MLPFQSLSPSLTKSYIFPLVLLLSVISGALFGLYVPSSAPYLKPFGDIFLHLLFTAIVPLVFFSVSSAIAGARSTGLMAKIIFYMMLVFIVTGLIAGSAALFIVKCFPFASNTAMPLVGGADKLAPPDFFGKLAEIFTAPSFTTMLSHQNILALMVFSILVGFAVLTSKDKGQKLLPFLQAGEDVFMRVFSFIMYYAPIGFFAFFAVLVKDIGSEIMEKYVQVAILYYVFASLYFVLVYSVYAYLAQGKQGIRIYWKNIFLPMITALATCSSAASIPANLAAAKKMQISKEIYETVIPIGSMIHKEGSIIGGMMKIAFLFAVFHLSFTGLPVLLTAVAVSVLVGTVMGAIPSGGMLGELLILSVYGFPPSTLVIIAAISIIIDPIATMLNVTGNTVSAVLIERLVKK